MRSKSSLQIEYPFTCLAIFKMLIEYNRIEAEVIRNLPERKENEEAR
nr:MAG TPA: hypothetical protein [Caudoviricetes sp.]